METSLKPNKENAPLVALVTGGATRVGRAISSHLASLRYTVIVHYNSSVDAARSLVEDLEKLDLKAILHQADFTLPRSFGNLINEIVDQTGRLDLLVNNAGIFAEDNTDIRTAALMKTVNYDAPIAIIDKAVVHLKKTGGSVVNIVDVAAVAPFENAKIYSKTKTALLSQTHKSAKKLLTEGVRVNAVCPGTVLFAENFSEEKKNRILEKIPMGRAGTPNDVAEAVAYLAGAKYVTGQIITVDGGLLLSKVNL